VCLRLRSGLSLLVLPFYFILLREVALRQPFHEWWGATSAYMHLYSCSTATATSTTERHMAAMGSPPHRMDLRTVKFWRLLCCDYNMRASRGECGFAASVFTFTMRSCFLFPLVSRLAAISPSRLFVYTARPRFLSLLAQPGRQTTHLAASTTVLLRITRQQQALNVTRSHCSDSR
jgi:hypothetical protein